MKCLKCRQTTEIAPNDLIKIAKSTKIAFKHLEKKRKNHEKSRFLTWLFIVPKDFGRVQESIKALFEHN